MSEDAETMDPVTPDTPAPEPAPISFGARLRWERERAGLTVTDVAARLRLHLNQVRAIEQESLDALPEAAYVRGFIRSYARLLNIDPAPLLEDLATKLVPATTSVVDGIAQHRDYSPVREAAREQSSRRFVILGAVLLLIVLGALGMVCDAGTHVGGSDGDSTGTGACQCADCCTRCCARDSDGCERRAGSCCTG